MSLQMPTAEETNSFREGPSPAYCRSFSRKKGSISIHSSD